MPLAIRNNFSTTLEANIDYGSLPATFEISDLVFNFGDIVRFTLEDTDHTAILIGEYAGEGLVGDEFNVIDGYITSGTEFFDHVFLTGDTTVTILNSVENQLSLNQYPARNNLVTMGLFGGAWELRPYGTHNFFDVDFNQNMSGNSDINILNLWSLPFYNDYLDSGDYPDGMTSNTDGNWTYSPPRVIYILMTINSGTTSYAEDITLMGANGSPDVVLTVNGTGPDNTTPTKLLQLVVMGRADNQGYVSANWLSTQEIDLVVPF